MDIRAIFMGLAFAFMWSSAFTAARTIVADAPPLFALSIRFLIAGIIGIALARALGQRWTLTRLQWRATIIFGFCQNALYLGLNFVAMQWIEASLAAIIASTMPLIVALLGWLVYGEKVRPLGLAGLVTGLGGVALIMGARLQGDADLLGIALCIIAAVSLAVATLAVRGASSNDNALMVVGLQMLVGSGALIVPALMLETFEVNWSWTLAAAFTYTTIVPGLVATYVWFKLVHRIGTVKASTFHFLNPFLGVAIAAALLGETLGPMDLIGVGVITLGILAVQLSKQVKV